MCVTVVPSDTELRATLLGRLADLCGLDDGEVTEATTFEELELDSLEKLEVISAAEAAVGVEVPDEEARAFRSVADVVAWFTDRDG